MEASAGRGRRSFRINTAAAAYSGTMDIILALLPWKIVWHVAIDKKEKIGALFAMSMESCESIADNLPRRWPSWVRLTSCLVALESLRY